MVRHHDFEVMIATRIELARAKTGALLATAHEEMDLERRRVLEECDLAIARAAVNLGMLKAANGVTWDAVQRDMTQVWRRMEIAVRLVTGEPPVTLVPPLEVPSLGPPMSN